VQYAAWTRQSPHIQIGELDGISDDGREVFNFLQQEGILHLIIMGVHTNMCVLNRSFGIKQMTRWEDIVCYLVRDLTDTMYDPAIRRTSVTTRALNSSSSISRNTGARRC